MLMQHVSTYNSHLQAKLSYKAEYQRPTSSFCTRHVLNPKYDSKVDISYFMYGEKIHNKSTVSHMGSQMRTTTL